MQPFPDYMACNKKYTYYNERKSNQENNRQTLFYRMIPVYIQGINKRTGNNSKQHKDNSSN